MVKIGYARVSSKWYRSEVQLSELKQQGCDRIWSDTAEDGASRSETLKAFLADVSPGDVIVVSRLSAIADTIAELFSLLERLNEKGASFRSMSEPWINTEDGRAAMVIEILGGVIDFELGMADLESRSAEDRPRSFGLSRGRPKKLSDTEREEAISLLSMGKTAAEIGRMLGVSRSTISRLKVVRSETG
ncbi:transposon gamma-delta resolvase [Roseobacter sp. SK209-2-6]|uniref:recombinase family protein n=1 Tax=Roseobacter sp. SK209-2-6 TaxID=388739 RepID=UPI0000F3D86D|nr:recombinase family protein [Roseobacter sp. SK209-2-6]EBA17477.1 transposon gamma-delta resolvase [Roseobacter sp. SK209-2-6]